MTWLDLYPSNHMPNTKDIEDFIGVKNYDLYARYINYLNNSLNLTYIVNKYNKSIGWYQSIGKSGIIMIKKITFYDSNFYINTVKIESENILNDAINDAFNLFHNIYHDILMQKLKMRSINNKIKRIEKNKIFNHKIKDLDEQKLNKFKWANPVSQLDIKRLYLSDANGMIDENILDKVGFGFYARCYQAREERPLLNMKKVKCHNCGQIIESKTWLYSCSCGYIYTFDEYNKSFKNNKLPSGNAIPIFDLFISKWELSNDTSNKMRIIDWIIHEIHIGLNGMTGRFIGQQLIEGTGAQIKELILTLAYGYKSIASLENLRRFEYHKNIISEKTYKSTNFS